MSARAFFAPDLASSIPTSGYELDKSWTSAGPFGICFGRSVGGGGQDRTADLGVMKMPISNTTNYLYALRGRQATPKYMLDGSIAGAITGEDHG
jgi:hypothetical protein